MAKAIRHLRCNKEMSYKEQFITKWKEQVRKDRGFYVPIINLSKLFK